MRALILLAFAPLCLFAQSGPPTEFPSDAAPVAPALLREQMAGKVYKGTPADGISWRIDYKANGYAFLDTSRGFRDTGKWRVEGTTRVLRRQRATSNCSEARVRGNTVFIKRASGEIVALQPSSRSALA